MRRRILPCGPGAVLVECADSADAVALWRRLQADPPRGVAESVPGARTVLVVGDVDEATRRLLSASRGGTEAAAPGRAVSIAVVYDGADLATVAATLGSTADEVADLHAAGRYTVGFGGFVPGFAYLTGLAAALQLPRRDTPRPRVPGGSVAVADVYTAVYPMATPGGWHILGTTTHVMFDAAREPAAALRPGDTVRFERVG